VGSGAKYSGVMYLSATLEIMVPRSEIRTWESSKIVMGSTFRVFLKSDDTSVEDELSLCVKENLTFLVLLLLFLLTQPIEMIQCTLICLMKHYHLSSVFFSSLMMLTFYFV
jgi:hypothetical protein